VADDDTAREVCRQLQRLLLSNGDGSNGAAAGPAQAKGSRALLGGPVLLDEMNKVSLHPSDSFSAKHLIQVRSCCEAFANAAKPSLMLRSLR
jgi:hypothetical protein